MRIEYRSSRMRRHGPSRQSTKLEYEYQVRRFLSVGQGHVTLVSAPPCAQDKVWYFQLVANPAYVSKIKEGDP